MSYNSKYTGQQVEDILDVANSRAYKVINHESGDTTFVLTPNTFHIWGRVTSLTLTLGEEHNGIMNEFIFQFIPLDSGFTLSLPSEVKWHDDIAPDFSDVSFFYQVSIINKCAALLRFKK